MRSLNLEQREARRFLGQGRQGRQTLGDVERVGGKNRGYSFRRRGEPGFFPVKNLDVEGENESAGNREEDISAVGTNFILRRGGCHRKEDICAVFKHFNTTTRA